MTDKYKPTIILENNKEYEIGDVLGCSQCSCGRYIDFDVYSDYEGTSWVTKCDCGLTISLHQSSMVECTIEHV